MCLPQVDGLNVAAAFFADIQSVQAFVVGKIGQGLLVLVAAVGTGEAVEKPRGITAGAEKPPCSAFLVEESKIRGAPADGAISSIP